jgi:quercetin dioxygenase-like cupin family protein
VPLAVEIKVWNFSERGAGLPASDFYVAQSLSGEVVTIINGKQETHSPGDFWIVSAGVPMFVRASRELAVLQTIAVRRRH